MKKTNKFVRRNYVTGIVTRGIYKTKTVEVFIGPIAKECKIFINKKDITNQVLSCNIKMHPDKPTTIYFEMIQNVK